MKKEKILLVSSCLCLLFVLVSLTLAAACSSQTADTATSSTVQDSKSSYSVAEGKVLTPEDIASVLGIATGDVTEKPVKKVDAGFTESFTVKIGTTSASVSITLTDTKRDTTYNAEPKESLANMKKSVATDSPDLGIGDYDSFVMFGKSVVFGKGIYMVQVTGPASVPMDKMEAIARLVAEHMQ
jgi:hypothetical protein